MEYVYAAMLLHKAGHKIEEQSVKKVLDAAGVKADDGRIKALIAALDGVNIDEAIKSAAVMAAPVASAPVADHGKPAAKKDDHKEEKQAEEASAAGLSALFG